MARTAELTPWQNRNLILLLRALIYEYGEQPRLAAALVNRGFDGPTQQSISRLLNGRTASHGTADSIARFLGKGYDYYFSNEGAPVIHGQLQGWEAAERDAAKLIDASIPSDVALYLARTLPVGDRDFVVTPTKIAEIATRLYKHYPEKGRERAATQMVADTMTVKSNKRSSSKQKI